MNPYLLTTHIHHNLIHDTFAYPYNTGFTSVYLDETSCGAVVENNIARNIDWHAFNQNFSYGNGNLFRNNIGAFARNGFLGIGGTNDGMNRVDVEHNIYITTNNIAQSASYPKANKPSLVSSNFYQTLEEGKPLLFCEKKLSEWQAMGWDIGSKEGNAGFIDPQGGDFSLKGDSPAVTQTGFVPFDREIATVGLYGDPSWCDFPKSCRMRKPYEYWSKEELAKLNDFSIDPNAYKPGTKFPVFSTPGQEKMIRSMSVTEEVAGINGPRCIIVTDSGSSPKHSYPSAQVQLYGLDKGRVEVGIALIQPSNSPTGCVVDLRRGIPQKVGPSIKITREGTIKAAGKEIDKMAPDRWTRFKISFGLGDDGDGSYELSLSDPSGHSGETKQTPPFVHKDFSEVTRLHISSPDKEDGKYYLDAISLKTDRK